jgi:hypothetical protein
MVMEAVWTTLAETGGAGVAAAPKPARGRCGTVTP